MTIELHQDVKDLFASEMLPIDEIIIGERFRKDYKSMEELCESIREKGLIHYPSIDQDNNLIAGGRRMEAMRLLGWKHVPVTRRNFMTPIKLRELELEENIQREDLTWQEEVNLKNELLKLKQSIHGVKNLGRNQPGMSQSDVAKMVGDSPSNFSLDVGLSNAMELLPELANCKTKDEARKKFKQLQEKLVVNELMQRKRAGETKLGSKFEQADQSFIICDALVALADHESFNYSFINCDPPYGIDLNNAKKGSENVQTIDHDYQEWIGSDYLQACDIVARETYRIVDNAYMCFWFGIQHYSDIYKILTEAGWKVDVVPGIWYALGAGQTNQPDLMLGKNYEAFFSCYKGKPILHKRGRSNVFAFSKLSPEKKIHPTEKPLDLMQEIIDTFCPEHGEILSPFLGSGVDIRAAFKSNRACKGFDLNDEVKKRFLLKIEGEFK
jgi:ParB family transcriptional regulator, chromosome partitioning protein